MQEIYGVEVSPTLISNVTDAVADEGEPPGACSRPLQPFPGQVPLFLGAVLFSNAGVTAAGPQWTLGRRKLGRSQFIGRTIAGRATDAAYLLEVGISELIRARCPALGSGLLRCADSQAQNTQWRQIGTNYYTFTEVRFFPEGLF